MFWEIDEVVWWVTEGSCHACLLEFCKLIIEFIGEGGIKTIGAISVNFRIGFNSPVKAVSLGKKGKVIKICLATGCTSGKKKKGCSGQMSAWYSVVLSNVSIRMDPVGRR